MEYIENTATDNRIWRQDLADKSQRKIIFSASAEKIFHFSRSGDGKRLALALGRQVNDAVLLSDFIN